MGHQRNTVVFQSPTSTLRRGYMPEPTEVSSHPEYVTKCGYFNEARDRNRRCPQRDTNIGKSSFNFTQTSCIMAIRNYVERMQSTKQKKKRSTPTTGIAEKLICSLKNDIKAISKIEEEVACNPGKKPAMDPCFVLSAMMCKINKLENLVVSRPDCKEQLSRRKDMIMMSKWIKKSLLDQAQCDEQLLQEKQRKTICLVKSLDMFEKEIRCGTKDIKRMCCPKSAEAIVSFNHTENGKRSIGSPEKPYMDNISKDRSHSSYSMKFDMGSPRKKNSAIDECTETSNLHCPDSKKYDITGLKLTYTKSHVKKDIRGKESEEVDNQVSCELNEDESCKVTLIKEGCPTPVDECNPILNQKMSCLSRLWMESARQLIETCTTYENQCC